MSKIPNEAIDAEIVEEESREIVLKNVVSLKSIVKTSPLIAEYKEVSEIDINLPVEEIAKNFLMIEKGYKAFRKNINIVARTRKEFTAPALAYQKECIAIEKDIISVLEPYSLRLKALKDKVEQEEARKQEEAERKEEIRIDTIKKLMLDVKNLPLQHFNSSVSELTDALESLRTVTPEVYAEFYDEAVESQNYVISQLQQARDNKIIVENAQKIQAEKEAEDRRLKEIEDAKRQSEKDEFEKQKAKFQKQKAEFEAMQREQEETLARREAIRLADELQAQQELQAKQEKVDAQARHEEKIKETMAVLNTYTEMIILIDDIIDGKVPHVKWVLDGK